MGYKELNKAFYEAHAHGSEAEAQYKFLRERMSRDIESFLGNLPGKDILDLGSGPGRDSVVFRERGFNPVCLDISPKMIKLCREKGLAAQVGDLESIPFMNDSFDGVWAFASLLHIPKANLLPALGNISRVLRPNGILYLGVKEGEFEGLLECPDYEGKRFFSLYSDEEMREALSERFEILQHSKVPSKRDTFLNYLCKRLTFRI